MVLRDDQEKALGSISYELMPESIIIRHIVVARGEDQEDALLYLLAKMVQKGGKRKYLRICVDMEDEKTIQALKKADFSFGQKAEGDQLICGRLISKGLGN